MARFDVSISVHKFTADNLDTYVWLSKGSAPIILMLIKVTCQISCITYAETRIQPKTELLLSFDKKKKKNFVWYVSKPAGLPSGGYFSEAGELSRPKKY